MKFFAVAIAVVALIALPLLQAQELPEGKGKDLVQTACSGCHGLDQVVQHKDTKDGWEGVVTYMISRGMAATDDEFKTIVDYLATTFPPATKGK